MKHSTILYAMAFLILSSCTEQDRSDGQNEKKSRPDTVQGSTENFDIPGNIPANVEDIQKSYSAIMTQLENSVLDSTTFNYSCYNEKGGTVVYYSYKDQLRAIVHRYHEYDHHSAVDRYFVKDSILFFINLSRTSWSFESGPEGSTKDDITEDRIYLINQRPLKCLQKKFTVHSQADSNPSSETVLNKEKDCSSLQSILGPYQLLLKYRYQKPSGCLEDQRAKGS